MNYDIDDARPDAGTSAVTKLTNWLSPWLLICAHAHFILFALECNNFGGSAIILVAVQYCLILHSNGPIRLQYLLQLYNNKYDFIQKVPYYLDLHGDYRCHKCLSTLDCKMNHILKV